MATENAANLGGQDTSSTLEQAAEQALAHGNNDGLSPQTREEIFLELQDEKGNKKAFKTRDEFLREYPKMGMLHGDYSRKTAALAEERKRFAAEREEQLRQIEQNKRDVEKYNNFLKNNPHVFKQLQEAIKRGDTPEVAQLRAQGYVDEKYKTLETKLKELEDWKSQRELSERKQALYSNFKSRYQDFDEDAVDTMLNTLASGDHEALIDMLYHANKGRMSPAQMEKRIIEKTVEKKKGALLPSGKSPQTSRHFKSLEEAEEAALEDLKQQ